MRHNHQFWKWKIKRYNELRIMLAVLAVASTIIILPIIALIIASQPAIAAVAYNDELLLDLNFTKEEFKDNNIDTQLLEAYILKIEELIVEENYDESDYLGDEAKAFSKRIFNLKGEIENSKNCIIPGCDEAKKIADEALFELGMGDFEAAEVLKNKSVDKKEEVHLRKKQELISMLLNSNNRSNNNSDNNSNLITSKNYEGRKKKELIEFAESINKNETQKILFFEKETIAFLKSEKSIEKIISILNEYRLIGGKDRLDDGVEEMILNLELGNYEQIAVMERELANTFFIANESARLIRYAVERGYDNSMAFELDLLSEAKDAFEEERFEDSIVLAKKAIDAGEKERSKSLILAKIKESGSGRILEFLSEHIIAILLLTIIFSVMIIKEYPRIIMQLNKWRISRLDERIMMKNRLLIDLQKKYYVENKISKKLYRTLFLKHQREVVGMKEKIAFMKEYEIRNDKIASGIANGKTGRGSAR